MIEPASSGCRPNELFIDFGVESWYLLTDRSQGLDMDLVMRQFGKKEPGQDYPERLSAYALLIGDDNRLLVVRHRGLLFLPGGGVDDGETLDKAVCREVLEEVGWTIQVVREVGHAGQYAFQPVKRRHVNKISHFFTAKITDRSGRGIEPDHQPMWVTVSEFAENAAHESHVWAAELALSSED